MQRGVAAGFAAAFGLLIASGSALASPPWCPTARVPAEFTICGNEELGNLDDVLNTAYKRARYDSPGSKTEIQREQRRWLGRRNLCGYDAGCLERRYLEQIELLESYYAN